MMIEPQFEVWLSDYLIGADIPFVLGIVTAFSTDDLINHTEYFYVRHSEDKSKWKAAGLRFSANPKDCEFAQSAQAFWTAETLPQLKNAIYYREIVPRFRKAMSVENSPLFSFELHKVVNSTLHPMGTIFPGFLEQTSRRTKCQALEAYIKGILSLHITTQDYSFE